MKLPDCIKTEENVPFIKGRLMAFYYPELLNDIHGAGDCEETAVSDLLDKMDDRKLEKLAKKMISGNPGLVPTWANTINVQHSLCPQAGHSKPSGQRISKSQVAQASSSGNNL